MSGAAKPARPRVKVVVAGAPVTSMDGVLVAKVLRVGVVVSMLPKLVTLIWPMSAATELAGPSTSRWAVQGPGMAPSGKWRRVA